MTPSTCMAYWSAVGAPARFTALAERVCSTAPTVAIIGGTCHWSPSMTRVRFTAATFARYRALLASCGWRPEAASKATLVCCCAVSTVATAGLASIWVNDRRTRCSPWPLTSAARNECLAQPMVERCTAVLMVARPGSCIRRQAAPRSTPWREGEVPDRLSRIRPVRLILERGKPTQHALDLGALRSDVLVI